MEDTKRRLLWHGMFLFLLGLLTGFVEQKFNNPRMGLAAHLEGVMNGTFLVATEGCGVLECALWYVRKLGDHYTGGDLRYGGLIADYSSWS
jgi:hydroxylaminobenzene mutase